MLEQAFLTVLNLSLNAAPVIACVLLARLALKKAPRGLACWVWLPAYFRLVCPWSVQSVLSLLPFRANPVPLGILTAQTPRVDTGVTVVDELVNAQLPAAQPQDSATPMQVAVWVAAIVWLAGAAALLAYSLIDAARLARSLRGAVRLEPGVYEAAGLQTPFVYGLARPRIYLPAGLTEAQRQCILLHERTHIRRADHLVKPLAFLVLCAHWFNPLAWAAFFLLGTDMESACDEAVIRRLGERGKKEYSAALLALSAPRRILGGTPLAFGESNVKQRIVGVLHYKKPAVWAVALGAAVLAVAVVGLCTTARRDDVSTVTFPAYSDWVNENNRSIYEIEPFQVSVRLPEGWKLALPPQEQRGLLPLTGWSPMLVLDETGKAVGSMGYDTFELYPEVPREDAERFDRMVYVNFMLSNMVDYQSEYRRVVEEGAFCAGATRVAMEGRFYFDTYFETDVNAQEDEDGYVHWPMVMAYDTDRLVYVTLSLDPSLDSRFTAEQLDELAAGIRFGDSSQAQPEAMHNRSVDAEQLAEQLAAEQQKRWSETMQGGMFLGDARAFMADWDSDGWPEVFLQHDEYKNSRLCVYTTRNGTLVRLPAYTERADGSLISMETEQDSILGPYFYMDHELQLIGQVLTFRDEQYDLFGSGRVNESFVRLEDGQLIVRTLATQITDVNGKTQNRYFSDIVDGEEITLSQYEALRAELMGESDQTYAFSAVGDQYIQRFYEGDNLQHTLAALLEKWNQHVTA